MSPIDEAVLAVGRGELIVFPTDTVYGIAARPDDDAATARLFEAKRRPPELALPVLAPSFEVASTLARLDDRARRLTAALWPGALTIVAPRTRLSRSWQLGDDAETIGVRVPRHSLALAVLLAAGPLATTSANRSGEPVARTCEELSAAFGDRVAIYLCQDEPLRGSASTVVDLSRDDARLLREGATDEGRVAELLGAEAPLLHSRPSGDRTR